MIFSAALVLCCGQDEAEFKRRATTLGRDPDELRQTGAAGTPAEVAEVLRAYAARGATRLYLQMLDQTDLDHLGLVAAEVVPQLS
jgi:alkanesulfonate monooxygenase SsuD/methylene tetrahydromethanopterin reductase-like flavin-dependent oxidoreductase (luciferase family)